jgi:hypothetical protein
MLRPGDGQSAMTEEEPRWPVRCSCGREYTEERWKALRFVGEAADDGGGALEHRVCTCGSTISVIVDQRVSGR